MVQFAREDPRLRGSAKNARALHFLFTGFAIIGVEEGSKCGLKAEPRHRNAIRCRYEPFRNPKPALLDRLHLRDGGQDHKYIQLLADDE